MLCMAVWCVLWYITRRVGCDALRSGKWWFFSSQWWLARVSREAAPSKSGGAVGLLLIFVLATGLAIADKLLCVRRASCSSVTWAMHVSAASHCTCFPAEVEVSERFSCCRGDASRSTPPSCAPVPLCPFPPTSNAACSQGAQPQLPCPALLRCATATLPSQMNPMLLGPSHTPPQCAWPGPRTPMAPHRTWSPRRWCSPAATCVLASSRCIDRWWTGNIRTAGTTWAPRRGFIR